MTRTKKRAISLLLAICMLLTLAPVAWAADEAEELDEAAAEEAGTYDIVDVAGIVPLSLEQVHDEAELIAALADITVTEIEIVGIVDVTAPVVIDRPLTLLGGTIQVQGTFDTEIIRVESPAGATIEGVTIIGDPTVGSPNLDGIYVTDVVVGSVLIEGVTIQNVHVDRRAGGPQQGSGIVTFGADVEVKDSFITSFNRRGIEQGRVGAPPPSTSNLTVTNTAITGNNQPGSTTGQNGIVVWGGEATVTGGTISDLQGNAGASSTAFFTVQDGDLTVSGTTIADVDFGFAVGTWGTGTPELDASGIIFNNVTGKLAAGDGAVITTDATLSMNDPGVTLPGTGTVTWNSVVIVDGVLPVTAGDILFREQRGPVSGWFYHVGADLRDPVANPGTGGHYGTPAPSAVAFDSATATFTVQASHLATEITLDFSQLIGNALATDVSLDVTPAGAFPVTLTTANGLHIYNGGWGTLLRSAYVIIGAPAPGASRELAFEVSVAGTVVGEFELVINRTALAQDDISFREQRGSVSGWFYHVGADLRDPVAFPAASGHFGTPATGAVTFDSATDTFTVNASYLATEVAIDFSQLIGPAAAGEITLNAVADGIPHSGVAFHHYDGGWSGTGRSVYVIVGASAPGASRTLEFEVIVNNGLGNTNSIVTREFTVVVERAEFDESFVSFREQRDPSQWFYHIGAGARDPIANPGTHGHYGTTSAVTFNPVTGTFTVNASHLATEVALDFSRLIGPALVADVTLEALLPDGTVVNPVAFHFYDGGWDGTGRSAYVVINSPAAGAMRELQLAVIVDNGTINPNAVVTRTFDVVIHRAPAPTASVGTQTGTMTAGVAGSVTFTVTTTGIANGTYAVTVANLPAGVTVLNDEVAIAGNTGTLTLTGDTTMVAAITNNLALTIAGAVSNDFTLTISAPSVSTPGGGGGAAPGPNRVPLENKLEAAQARSEANYTDESWAALVEAKEAAEAVLARTSPAANQAQLDEAYAALREAYEALENLDGGKVPTQRFVDVGPNNWFYTAVMFVYERGLMEGTTSTTFAPNVNLNRAMVATILYRMAGEPAVTFEAIFPDVAAGRWYSNAIVWAYHNDVVTGFPDGSFRPADLVTREQFAAMLFRYAEVMGYDTGVPADFGLNFPDAGLVGNWARNYMEWAVYNGLITGTPQGELNPRGTATRAECATILMRFVQTFVD